MIDKVDFAIDRGGTFTDVYAVVRYTDGSCGEHTRKLLSDSDDYPDAVSEGIRRTLIDLGLPCSSIPLSSSLPIPLSSSLPSPLSSSMQNLIPTTHIGSVRLGTTVATNALLERKGGRFAVLLTEGLEDTLRIGTQQRPDIFALHIEKPEPLYDCAYGIRERIILHPESKAPVVHAPLDEQHAQQVVAEIKARGIDNVAIALCHANAYPEHERKLAQLCRHAGFRYVAASHELQAAVSKYLSLASTVCIDAYLWPVVSAYLQGFASCFSGPLHVDIMTSDGSLFELGSMDDDESTSPTCELSTRALSPSRLILSGPAGGVRGAALGLPPDTPVLSFDMGGTSTDVCRFVACGDDGQATLDVVDEASVAFERFVGHPQLAISTVAAGGGSLLTISKDGGGGGLLQVGPESAGARPGSIVYGLGGTLLTVTDANFILGRIDLDSFSHGFSGASINEGREAAYVAFQRLNSASNDKKTPEHWAQDFVDVANETMARPMRALTEGRGVPAARHVLNCFGGAGGQHACAIADLLGISTVHVHRHCSLLSAVGISRASVVLKRTKVLVDALKVSSHVSAQDFEALQQEAELRRPTLASASASEFGQSSRRFRLFMKYRGADTVLPIELDFDQVKDLDLDGECKREFEVKYKERFGFLMVDRPVVYQSVELIASRAPPQRSLLERQASSLERQIAVKEGRVFWRDQWLSVPVSGFRTVECGPALLVNAGTSVWLEPGWSGHLDRDGNLALRRLDRRMPQLVPPLEPDAAWQSRFALRFMAVSEQMGRVLEQSAVSVNIKERLDFSCAVFEADGSLIANAPHIPVHLGAMQAAIRFQLAYLAEHNLTISDGMHMVIITFLMHIDH